MIEIIKIFTQARFGWSLFGLLFSLQAFAADSLFSSPEVDIVWDAGGRLSNDERVRYRRRAGELATFYRARVLPSIPGALWPAGAPPALTVRFRDAIPSDGGLFVPPPTESGAGAQPARVTVDVSAKLITNGDAERTLAHEVFHALHWVLHPDEPAWLREGMAQLFETRVYAKGKFNTNNLGAGFAELSTSLQSEMHVDAVSAAQYGHGLLYFWYLYGRCGGESLFWALVNPGEGIFGARTVEYALKKAGVAKPGCRDFADSFVEFELARAINQRALDGADPDRWFVVASALARAKPEKRLPDAARWSRVKPWTPILVEADVPRVDAKTLPGVRAFWIQPGSSPRVTETLARPSPKATRVLLLRLP